MKNKCALFSKRFFIKINYFFSDYCRVDINKKIFQTYICIYAIPQRHLVSTDENKTWGTLQNCEIFAIQKS